MSKRPSVICILSLLVGSGCFAEAQNSPPIPQKRSDETLGSYGQQDKYCLEWTDGCVNCVRGQAGGGSGCSNIGIACQSKEVMCVRRLELSSYATCTFLLNPPC